MSHTLSPLSGALLNEALETLTFKGRTYQLPCLISSNPKIVTITLNKATVQTYLLSLPKKSQPMIVLIGSNKFISSKEQYQWVIFGQEHGFIFQWFMRQHATQTFNLLCQEGRDCLVFIE